MFMQIFKKRFGIYPLLINILLLFASCGEDNPLAPSKKELSPLEPSLEEMLTYFPLAEGKQWKYEYTYENRLHRDNLLCIEDSIHTFRGTFLLTVLRVDSPNQWDNEGTFFTLSATFEIEKEQYGYVRTCVPPWTSFDSSYTRENFTVSIDYYLMLRDWSLWYVKNSAPSGSTPVDSTTLMMERPADTLGGPGKVNLKMFNYPGIDLFPDKRIMTYSNYSGANIDKTRGVTYIDYLGGEWHKSYSWSKIVEYKLIDE